ncbi:MAG: hypothetical protein NTW19_08260 [Planctomycetota bacterium]|nr:hypothetical protein [Planctomycetota bacterium]
MPEAVQIEEIQKDLACPGCEYNLRGLRGAVVHCPECGYRCDVAKLIAYRWKGSIWKVPGVRLVESPVLVAAVAGLFVALAIIGFISPNADRGVIPVFLAIGFTLLVPWFGMMVNVHRRWGGWEGVRLSMMAHGFIPIWYSLSIGPLVAMGLFFSGLVIPGLILGGAVVASFWLCRRLDRRIAERCLRRHLAAKAAEGETIAPMPDAGPIEDVQNDLACPGCGYNLRGLRGAVVDCPECGLRCDVAKLIAYRWKGSIWKVPGVNLVESPVMIAAVTVLIALFVEVAHTRNGVDRQVIPTAVVFIVVFALRWVGMMVNVRRKWGGWDGVRLSLKAHGFIPLWFIMTGTPIAGGVMIVTGDLALGFFLCSLCAVGFFLHRRLDRWIAEQCLRHHLAEMAAANDKPKIPVDSTRSA